MSKAREQVLAQIHASLSPEEELIGFFIAQTPLKLWLFFLIGPLGALSLRMYYVAVTNQGMHFHKLTMLGKFSQHDFFLFDDIMQVKIGSGTLQLPMTFIFQNKRKLKLKAQKAGVKKVAKVTPETLEYIKQHIKIA